MTRATEQPTYAFAGFHLDAQRRVLSRAGGDAIPLAPKVFDTLLYLVEHRGELLDKHTLLDAVWPHVVVEENNLNQSISTLRRVLGERPGEHRFIVTEPGRGFRFVASVVQAKNTPDGFASAITQSEEARTAATAEPAPAQIQSGRSSRATGVSAMAALLALAGVAGWSIASRPAPETSTEVMRLSIASLEDPSRSPVGVRHIAISADGSRVANSGASRLWIRRLSEEAWVIVEMNTSDPFFSPDGHWLGFFNGETGLMKVPTAGGTPQLIAATTERTAGAAWARDGTIVFATTEGLYRVGENGGEPELLKRPDPLRGERLYAWPELVPDGQSLLFTVIPEASTDPAQIAVLNLGTGESKIILNDGTAARYAASGHLLYASGQSLNAIAFDRNALETRGEAIVVPDTEIATAKDNGAAEFAVSATGTLLSIAPRAPIMRTVSWVDRDGDRKPLAPELGPGEYNYPRISPKGTLVALDMSRNGNRGIYIWNLERQSLTRLMTGSTEDILPLWSPDEGRVFFASNRQGTHDVYSQAANGASEARVEFEGEERQFPESFTPDGARLVVYEDRGLSVLNIAQPDRLEPLLLGESNSLGELSPDGNWIAYESNESGQFEIYLSPFPNVGARRENVSIDGGRYPRWDRYDNDELFYVDLHGGMMAVPVQLSPSLELGRVTKLFDGVRPPSFVSGNPYDISPLDGRFLVVAQVALPGESTKMSVVVNWFKELRELVPQR